MGPIGFRELTVILLAGFFTVFWLIPAWQITKKTGFNPAMTLLVLVPFLGGLIGLILFWILAFKQWPLERRAKGSPSG